MEITCPLCGGSGLIGEKICTLCEGKKVTSDILEVIQYYAAQNKIVADSIKAYDAVFANLIPTCKIGNCIDGGEWGALTADQVAGVNRIMSCGFVDMGQGEWARVSLWGIFADGSKTRAALIAMFR